MDLTTGAETNISTHNYNSYYYDYFSVVDNYIIKSRTFQDGYNVPQCTIRHRKRISIEKMSTREERDLILPGLF